MVRGICPTAWLDKTLALSSQYPLIVEDGRYLNEFDSIKSLGGYCIVIDRLTPTSRTKDTHPQRNGNHGYTVTTATGRMASQQQQYNSRNGARR